MKITIATTTVKALAAHVSEVTNALQPGCSSPGTYYPQVYKRKHHSVDVQLTARDSQFVFEIDDAILLRIAAVYVKVAVFIAPIVAACNAFAKTLKGEVEEIDTLLTEE